MKKDIAKMVWICATCKKEQHGGNRYANHKGGHDCWECTPYLKDGDKK